MYPSTMSDTMGLITISVIWGIALFSIAWFTRMLFINKTSYVRRDVDPLRCPRQLCSNYKIKCSTCSRQIREDKFEAAASRDPNTGRLVRYGLMCDKRYNCSCHMVPCEDGTYVKFEQ